MGLFEYIDMPKTPYDIFITESTTSPLHWHYYSEIIHLQSGEVTLVCNGNRRVLREGDLCYIYPLRLHEFQESDGKPVRYAVIKFDIHTINIPPAYLFDMYDYFLRRAPENDDCIVIPASCHIAELVEKTVAEYAEKREFYSLAVQADIHAILIELARSGVKKYSEKSRKTDLSFTRVLEYIDAHSSEPLEAAKLAEMCHMSYSNFARLFRESYGRSCKEYVTYIRLNKAQELLLHTNRDLSFIAQETGFYDCSHFIRAYKKQFGITPKQERTQS